GSRETQQPSRPLAEVTRGFAGGDELLEGGFRAQQEPFAGFGQADAARGADEERCTDARLECAHRLADRRWGHRELRGRSSEISVLGDAEECLHAVECALPDCEVLLHSPSILSRIIACGEAAYIRLASRKERSL